jgi:hypothetical protein
MVKTISHSKQSSFIHPALGTLVEVGFTDGSSELIYEESFFHAWEEYNGMLRDFNLVGRQIDTSECIIERGFKLS